MSTLQIRYKNKLQKTTTTTTTTTTRKSKTIEINVKSDKKYIIFGYLHLFSL
jgi:hypothetical protein